MTEHEFNPYVGPRPFERKKEDAARFFGRSQEREEIVSLIFGHPVILIYAQSGAGKTSLFNASVALKLEESGFDVLPLTRVGGVVPKGVALQDINNLYVFNALLKMDPERDPQTLLSQSLSTYLEATTETTGGNEQPRPRVIVFDQFEELFTYTPERWREQRDGFFLHVAEALNADPLLRVVLMIREDFLAELDPYSHNLPERLRTRYRLERLGANAALRAIKDPLVNTPRSFASGVAEEVVRELLVMKTVDATGKTAEIEGQYVEPVQLQVVCVTLWSSLEPDCIEIQQSHLKNFNVNDALSNFYRSAVESSVKETGVPETELRNWFAKTLITPLGTRSTVFRGEDSTGGIENSAVDFLESRHIIRADFRAGARWYELTHDRLVEPILANNQTWFENLSPLQRQAMLWNEQGRKGTWLFSDQALVEVERWANEHQDELTRVENEFLEECQTEQREKAHIQQARQRRFITNILIASTIIMLALTVFGFVQANMARKQAIISRAGELAAQAQRLITRNLQISLLLSIESFNLRDNVQTRGALLDTVNGNPQLLQFLAGHHDEIYSVAFSPDGRTLASGSKDKTIILWDVKSYEPVGELKGHTGSVASVAFSPDGLVLASGSTDKTIILWNMESRQPVGQPLTGHEVEVYSVAFNSDGSILASGGADGKINLWNVESHQPIDQPLVGHNNAVTAVAFSPDARIVASGSADNSIILWDAESHQPIDRPLVGHSNSITTVAFSPDSKLLASGSADDRVILWDVESHQPVGQLVGHNGPITSIAFSPDGKTLVSGSVDRTLILWDIDSRQSLGSPLTGHVNWVRDVAFSPDGKEIASGGSDDMVIIWDLDAQSPLSQILPGHKDAVYSVAISPDGQVIASGSVDETIILWDVKTGQPLAPALTVNNGTVNSVAFSPNEKLLASGYNNGSIILWDLESHQQIDQLDGDGYAVYSIAFSHDGKILASGNDNNSITLWDVQRRQQIDSLDEHTSAVNSVAFSPDGKILASGSSDKNIVLWDVETRQRIGGTLTGHDGIVYSIAFTPDGKVLASVSTDLKVILWNIEDHQPIKSPLTSQTGIIYTVAFSPDGTTLATGGYKSSIQLWNVENIENPFPMGQLLLQNKDLTVSSLAFSPDSKTLISGSADSSVIIWDLDPQHWTEKICQRVGRNFAHDEWPQYFPGEIYRLTCPQWPERDAVSTPTP